MKTIKVLIKGITALIMDNGMSANPVDSRELPDFLVEPGKESPKLFRTATKALTGKRDKKEQDYERLSKLDFYSSLYLNEKNQVIVPAECFEAALFQQAKENKLGKKLKMALTMPEDALLEFPNSNKPMKEWYSKHSYKTIVKVSMAKTLSTRAIFGNWQFRTVLEYNPKYLEKQQLIEILSLGRFYGFMSRRPKFGRHSFEILKGG